MIKYYLTPKAIKAGCKFEQPREGDAGFDIMASEKVKIPPRGYAWIPTGLHVRIPSTGLYPRVGIIKDRSSVAADGVFTHAGVIDSNYTGEIKILLENVDDNLSVTVIPGRKLAQMIIVQYIDWPTKKVNSIDDLGRTVRGDKGFGSTGT